ncbi:hypothetical protein BOTBODRAFT_30647 [Botryobasidium botryosum FD-172 SS1]|uniref:Protein kinase domain-containing protein n=1 Tax=Botryobasidium botryosum (strain FD-172 SS1) TaxID=930990 RepID=A0A067MYW8_BOTB1|nr:hypothetical protein BOTBODRAFT_30647 [Botryobasidium botryosum FD-172 SS1]
MGKPTTGLPGRRPISSSRSAVPQGRRPVSSPRSTVSQGRADSLTPLEPHALYQDRADSLTSLGSHAWSQDHASYFEHASYQGQADSLTPLEPYARNQDYIACLEHALYQDQADSLTPLEHALYHGDIETAKTLINSRGIPRSLREIVFTQNFKELICCLQEEALFSSQIAIMVHQLCSLSTYEPPAPVVDLSSVVRLGTEPLGKGGFGECWQGLLHGKYKVAMKCPHDNVPKDAVLRQVRREATVCIRNLPSYKF